MSASTLPIVPSPATNVETTTASNTGGISADNNSFQQTLAAGIAVAKAASGKDAPNKTSGTSPTDDAVTMDNTPAATPTDPDAALTALGLANLPLASTVVTQPPPPAPPSATTAVMTKNTLSATPLLLPATNSSGPSAATTPTIQRDSGSSKNSAAPITAGNTAAPVTAAIHDASTTPAATNKPASSFNTTAPTAAAMHDVSTTPAATNEPASNIGRAPTSSFNTTALTAATVHDAAPVAATITGADTDNTATTASASTPISTGVDNLLSATRATEISTPVGSPPWREQVGATVAWMVNEHVRSAEVRVSPPDLGPIEIRVSLTGDQHNQAAVQFVAPHAATRDALEAALPRLRDMLADAGVVLSDASVGSHQQQDSPGTQQPATVPDDDVPRHARPVAVTSLAAGTGNSALVDTFA